MKRNVILAVVLVALVGIYYFGQTEMEKEVDENIKQESLKLFKNFSTASINEIQITDAGKGRKVQFKKEGENWKVADKDCNAQKKLIDRILEAAPQIRLGEKVGDWQPEYMQKYGFDKGMEIRIGNSTFNLGKQVGTRIALRHDGKLYLSPFRQKHVFIKYDGNWCEEKKEEEKTPEKKESKDKKTEKSPKK